MKTTRAGQILEIGPISFGKSWIGDLYLQNYGFGMLLFSNSTKIVISEQHKLTFDVSISNTGLNIITTVESTFFNPTKGGTDRHLSARGTTFTDTGVGIGLKGGFRNVTKKGN